jgi:putative FmdB family regulatory protein
MPFYEYQCRHCGHQTEVLQKVSDPPLRKCPACGRNGLTKLISAPIFRLKGGGWYETDFKGDQDRKRNLANDEAPPDKKGEGDKPAAKSADKASDKPAERSADKPAAKPAASKAAAPRSAAKKPSSSKPAKRSPARKPAARPK